ncbi:hypothetical protein D3C80_1799050 [compost metagenome]
MASKKPNEMSNADLLKNEKMLKTITYMLIGALIALFVVGIILIANKGLNALLIIPITLIPVVLINFNSLKEIQKEIKTRNI